MVDLHKIRQEMSPNVAKIDAVKLLKLFYNKYLCDTVKPMYAGRVDSTMLAWLQEKAHHCMHEQQRNTDAWIDFLLALDRDYLQMAIEYVNELEI